MGAHNELLDRSASTLRAVLVLLLWSAPISGQDRVVVNSDVGLPDAPEKVLVMQYCVSCHAIERIQHAGGNIDGWSDRVRRMIRWGSKIPMSQVHPVAEYLAKALPPRLRPTAAESASLNTAVSATSMHSIQTTVRTSGAMEQGGTVLTASVDPSDSALVSVGQRVRAFQLGSRASTYQGKIVRVTSQNGKTLLTASLTGRVSDAHSPYLVEVVAERGRLLAVPNEAIIEEEERRIVYLQRPSGDYEPREIKIGVQGDLYTQVTAGLAAGDPVVTLGGFFIDSQYKMNSQALDR